MIDLCWCKGGYILISKIVYTYKIFKTVLQTNRFSYNFVKCIFATNKDQTFILHILQVRFESAKVSI